MRLPRILLLTLLVAAIAGFTLTQATARAADAPASPQPVRFDGGLTTLDGPWQFHLGDDSAWAAARFDDSGWEKLDVDKPWGEQGHAGVDGYAWYRRHLSLAPGETEPEQLAILIPAVEDAYELYWSGRFVGTYGAMPPYPVWYYDMRPHTWGLGSAQSGVLAIRVWKAPYGSYDSGKQGGFYAPPVLGSPMAIGNAMSTMDYHWMRGSQVYFALDSLYGLVAVLGFLFWLRDRSQWLAFWMACFAAAHPLGAILVGLKLPLSLVVAMGLNQPVYVLGDISMWYVLVWLLGLHDDARVVRLTRILAIVEFTEGIVDGCLTYGFSLPHPLPWQVFDLALMPVVILLELYPFYLIGYALVHKRKLDPARWIVAVLAFLSQTIFVAAVALSQGSRFTHWTIGDKINSPLFTVLGNGVNARTLTGALLLVALVYAVYRYSAESHRQQARLEEEIRNARAVQQVLIPEAIPATPGFKVESVYKPAEEVGGDFFQIMPLRGGGVLSVIGDVSGKGIPAAMTVSLLVGTVRTLAHYTQSPAEILAAMNQRMLARSHDGGFTTCLILRADPDGKITAANAGHLAPYLRCREMVIEGGLPLGLAANAVYTESTTQLAEGEQLTLLTDGVVEARSKSGELFGFDRTSAIAADTAESIAQAAQSFGQQDDITVLTLSRSHGDGAILGQRVVAVTT
ncbi:MAG: SpoIIE family protein phosphatase [Terracidiphilus sp.]